MDILKNSLVIRGIILLAVAIALGLALSRTKAHETGLAVIEDPERPGRFRYTFEAMGTDVAVIVNAPARGGAQRIVEAGVRKIVAADAAMSDYRPDSEVSLLNREGAKGPVELSPDTITVLQEALRFSKVTGGAFDVTYAPLRAVWRKARKDDAPPSEDDLKKALRAVGCDKLLLSGRTARFAVEGMEVDLGGIAAGFAIDRAIEAMKEAGLKSGLLDISGDIRVVGLREDGKPWKIQVKDSRPGEHPPIYLRLKDMAVSTSGDYERYFTMVGKHFSHIIDPRTGRPAGNVPSATVAGPDAITTDALSTAISVLGPQKGVELVDSLEGVECMIMARTGGPEPEIFYSKGFRALIEEQSE